MLRARSSAATYCRGTVRHIMLVNSCYISRGMAARSVSNSRSDLQDYSRALAMVPFDILPTFLPCNAMLVWYIGVAPLEFCRDLWHQQTRVPGLSYGVCVILGIAIFV